MKYILCLLFLIQFKNCKSETQSLEKISNGNVASIKQQNTVQDNYIVNSIDKNSIGEKIADKSKIEFLKSKLLESFDREIVRPYMWDIFTSSNDTLLEFHPFKNFTINGFVFKSYYINIHYEDATYQAILIINDNSDNLFDSLIIYENLESEEKYQRISRIIGDKIEIQLKNKVTENKIFIIKNGLFLDYFQEQNVDMKWGNKEERHSDTVYEYELKGKTNNHLKDGYWIEKKYSMNYGKIIIEDGTYKDGIKDGEWNYSPDGPVDKVDLFKNGVKIKTYYP
ncbi:hypothetical protein [Chryseobacterium sp. MFBS3-17]|uniref:hypothetical protein n=1 Tax=Chryseobacterium sp. MFBS3-17 TaxID=2886689 RepID=UPI001D0EA043|nr:hypothetical protein [Chryseobacterium sp. MFBS3-17]MCC2589781.1 hypothetical protein [Chryseobacterium sp. MFBS3-17]